MISPRVSKFIIPVEGASHITGKCTQKNSDVIGSSSSELSLAHHMRNFNNSEEILNHLRHLLHGLNETLERAYTEHGLQLIVTLLDDRSNEDYCDSFVQQIRIKRIEDIV